MHANTVTNKEAKVKTKATVCFCVLVKRREEISQMEKSCCDYKSNRSIGIIELFQHFGLHSPHSLMRSMIHNIAIEHHRPHHHNHHRHCMQRFQWAQILMNTEKEMKSNHAWMKLVARKSTQWPLTALPRKICNKSMVFSRLLSKIGSI